MLVHSFIHAFEVDFIVEYSQIPNLATGHLQALQHKPSRQLAVVFIASASVFSQLVLVYHIIIINKRGSSFVDVPLLVFM